MASRPKIKTGQFTVRISPEFKALCKEMAQKENISIAELIIRAITDRSKKND